MRRKLPIGIEFFEEFSQKDYYYVDKTAFIAELLNNGGKVNLFTRPRRFGSWNASGAASVSGQLGYHIKRGVGGKVQRYTDQDEEL